MAAKRDERWVLAAAVLALSVVALLPMLGSYGLWDPQEIALADAARRVATSGDYVGLWRKELPLETALVATSTVILGPSEFAARLPLALLGIAGALATYGLGARLRRPRAGLFAAIALLGSPLFVFQARQLIGDIGAVSGSAIAMYGLVGLAWPAAERKRWQLPVDLALAAVGLLLGLFSAGLFVGVFVPLAAAAGAAALFAPARRFAFACGGVAAAVAILLVGMIFHLEPAQPGARALFGKMLVAAKDYLPWLGGAWRSGDTPVSATFDVIVNQVAFGFFPWSALAPVAVLRLAVVRERDRATFGGVAMLAWALAAYVATSLWVRAIGDVRYPALPALAVALGVFLDDLLAAKVEGDSLRMPDADAGLRIGAVFVVMAALILALDTRNFPDTLPSIHILGTSVKFPHELALLEGALIFFGVAFGVTAGAGMFIATGPGRLLRFERRDLARAGILGAAVVGGVYALFLSFVLVPKLSQHFSYKNLFEAYFDHRQASEPLGVMGIPGSGPEYYARGKMTKLDTVQQLVDLLKKSERVFAIAPADRLCQLHQSAAGQPVEYHLLDNKNSRFMLLSNRLAPDEKDESPLVGTFKPALPAHMTREIGANFDDTIELVGADLPESVSHGSTFKVTLWLRVKKRPTQAYKVFAHFDGPGVRFQGDHDQPGACSTIYWQPGDIIADTFDVTAGELTHPRGVYTLFVGFFTGGAGIYHNMPVLSANKDSNNRVTVGPIRVD
jgi:4-amino-4-deoxy-L-arabinose transferase-like glycosyltransferase